MTLGFAKKSKSPAGFAILLVAYENRAGNPEEGPGVQFLRDPSG